MAVFGILLADYLTYATGDHAFDAEIAGAILAAVVANPYVMRDMPRLLRQSGLEIINLLPHVHAEAGQGAFFASLAETYVPLVIRERVVAANRAESWLAGYRQVSEHGDAFSSCSYFTSIARRPA